MRFRSGQHLRRSADFVTVRAEGKSTGAGPLVVQMRVYPSVVGAPPQRRLGVVASRRVGGAVIRNRCKRLLRECFRRLQDELPPACDLVLIARSGLEDSAVEELLPRLRRAIARLLPPPREP